MFNVIRDGNHYKMLSGGQWQKADEFIEIVSPLDNDIIGYIPSMTKQQISRTISDCAVAQKTWAKLSLFKRCEIMLAGAQNLYDNREAIATVLANEISKEYGSCVSEIVRSVDFIRASVEAAKGMQGSVVNGDMLDDNTKNKTAIVKRVPIGVVLAVSPFNYPINLAISKIAPALIMGNTVVFKPATGGVISALHMIRCLEIADLPKDVITIITGRGELVGPHLMTHTEISMINFTGSTDVGKKIAENAGLIPVIMELGGKDPAIVLDNSNLKKNVSQIVAGAFGYSGQRCTAIKRVIVLNSIADELVAELKVQTAKVTVGSPFDGCLVTPLINQKAADFVISLTNDAKKKGASVTEYGQNAGNLICPKIIDYVTTNMHVYYQEPFGPILPIIRVATIEDAIAAANDTEYGLQACIFGENINELFMVAESIDVGTVNLNGKSERSPDNFPFLGRKNSGLGVQGIQYALEASSTLKSIVINR